MAIHWKILFKSLRAGTDYTVNVYDDSYTGTPVVLKGGAQPFSTEENNDEDPFVFVREQSGHIRIVDDGLTEGGSIFSWEDMVPQTDLDRPVTLTAGGQVVWQGFMQAQNFSNTLYGGTQEREFPVQCLLSVMGAKDIDHTQKQVHNFAYVIDKCFAAIGITPQSSPLRVGSFYFQGANGIARSFLVKLIDWQNFVTDNGDGTISARFDALTAITDVCRFWGWTVRTIGHDVWFVCADDSADVPGFLKLTHTQLQSIGNEADTTVGTELDFTDVNLDEAGDIFASMQNDDIMTRGASTAVVTADSGTASDALVEAWPEYIERQMLENTWSQIVEYYSWQGVKGSGGEWRMERAYAKYTTLEYNIATPFFKVTCNQSYAGLCLAQLSSNYDDLRYATGIDFQDSIQLKKEYDPTRTLVQIETEFEHVYDGEFVIKGDVYKSGYCYKTNSYTLNHSIKMRFGIGQTRSTAKWYDGNYGWSNTQVIVDAHVNFNDGIWRFGDGVRDSISIGSGMAMRGKVFIDLLGGIGEYDWFPDGSYPAGGLFTLDIVGFTVDYTRPGFDFLTLKKVNLDGRKEYKASNNNMSRNRWDDDAVYASGNLQFGYGLVFNENTLTPLINAHYYTKSTSPEQHLVERVANYWRTSSRLLSVELRSEIASVGGLNPGQTVTLAGKHLYPLSISRDWRDDVSAINLIKI